MAFNPSTWPTFQQSMPIAQGAMTGEALQRAFLQNQMQKQQNQFQPDLNAAKLAQMQAATQGQTISNQQAPEMMGLKEYMAQIAAKNAEHGQQNIQLQRDKMGALYGNAAARLGNLPAMQALMGNDPSVMQNVLGGSAGFAGNFAQAQAQPGMQPPPPQQQMQPPMQTPNFPALQQYMQGAQGGQPQGVPQQQPIQQQQPQPASLAQQYIQGGQGGQIPQQQEQPASDDILQQAQDATLSKMIKTTTPEAIQKQRYFTQTFDNFAGQISDMMPVLSQYSGISGQFKLKKDQIDAARGVYNPDYEKYITFKTFTAPNAANELKRSLSGQASDKEMEVMMKMIDPNLMASNPKLYEQRWKSLVEQSRGISDIASKSLAQVSKMNQQPQARTPSSAIPSVAQGAPAGTVEMISEDGMYHAVHQGDVESATSYGWKKA